MLLSVACGTASQSQTHSEVVQASGGNVERIVARVGDHEITMAELDQKVLATNVKICQDLYDARSAALGELVADVLLAREAEKPDAKALWRWERNLPRKNRLKTRIGRKKFSLQERNTKPIKNARRKTTEPP